MYAYFDDTKRFWHYLCIVYVFCIPLYAGLRYLQASILFSCVSVILIELIAYIVIINYHVNKANAYMQKIEAILYEDCDVQLFQIEISRLLERIVKNQTQRCKLIYFLALSKRVEGNIEEATLLLVGMKEDVVRLGNDQKCPIYIALAQCYMDVQNLNEAHMYIQHAQNALLNTKLNKQRNERDLEEALLRYHYMMGKVGSHDYITSLKKSCKENADTTLQKVIIYAQLMEMSKRTKNENEGIMCAYYIVKHAKNLPCVEAANKLLEGCYE